MGKGLVLLEGEHVEYERRCNAQLPKGRGHKSTPGYLWITNRRVVHAFSGLLGIGSSRWELPLRRVSSVSSTGSGLTTSVEVTGIDGSTARFTLSPTDAEAAATAIRMGQAES